MVRPTRNKDTTMTSTKHDKRAIGNLTAQELELVTGGIFGGVASQTGVICKLPADRPETYCGTKGPGVHIPSLKI